MKRLKKSAAAGAVLALGLAIWLGVRTGLPPDAEPGAATPGGSKGATAEGRPPDTARRVRWRESPGTAKIVTIGQETEQLWDGQKLIFQAKRIRTWCQTAGGDWVIAAVTGSGDLRESAEPTVRDGRRTLEYSHCEIWLVSGTGETRKLTPDEIDAGPALASPDGRKIAFSGCYVDADGFPPDHRILLLDLATGVISSITDGNEQGESEYITWPEEWSEDGKSLKVAEDYGESGGHTTRRIFAVHG